MNTLLGLGLRVDLEPLNILSHLLRGLVCIEEVREFRLFHLVLIPHFLVPIIALSQVLLVPLEFLGDLFFTLFHSFLVALDKLQNIILSGQFISSVVVFFGDELSQRSFESCSTTANWIVAFLSRGLLELLHQLKVKELRQFFPEPKEFLELIGFF